MKAYKQKYQAKRFAITHVANYLGRDYECEIIGVVSKVSDNYAIGNEDKHDLDVWQVIHKGVDILPVIKAFDPDFNMLHFDPCNWLFMSNEAMYKGMPNATYSDAFDIIEDAGEVVSHNDILGDIKIKYAIIKHTSTGADGTHITNPTIIKTITINGTELMQHHSKEVAEAVIYWVGDITYQYTHERIAQQLAGIADRAFNTVSKIMAEDKIK